MALSEIQAKFGGKWKVERTGDQTTLSSIEDERQREENRIFFQMFQVENGKLLITAYRKDTHSTSEYVLDGETVTEDWGVKHKASARYVDGKLTTVLKPMDSDVAVKTIDREFVDGKVVVTGLTNGRSWTSQLVKV